MAEPQSSRSSRAAGRYSWLNRSLTFTVSMPRLLFGAGFAVLLLTWVFTFGILIGRGHKPEEKVPQLAELMPTPRTQEAPADPEVLERRDLAYHEALRSRNPEANSLPRVEQQASVAPRENRPAPASRPGTDQARTAQTTPSNTSSQQQSRQAAQPSRRTDQTPARPSQAAARQQQAERFKYLYQVASYKDHSPAENFRARLQSAGMTASIETVPQGETTWYRVLISFVGTPEEAERTTKGLSRFGINKVLMRSKRPV